MFNKETYIQRRNRLKKEIGKGILLFLGNNESGMNYADNTYHFRQDSTFLYFFGSDYAGLSALIDIDEDREIIFGDELTIDDIVWMGTQPTIREKSASVGITATAPTAQLSDYLNKAVQQGRRIHYLPPYRGEHQVTLLRLLGIAPEAQVAGASTELSGCSRPTKLQIGRGDQGDRRSSKYLRRYAHPGDATCPAGDERM